MQVWIGVAGLMLPVFVWVEVAPVCFGMAGGVLLGCFAFGLKTVFYGCPGISVMELRKLSNASQRDHTSTYRRVPMSTFLSGTVGIRLRNVRMLVILPLP